MHAPYRTWLSNMNMIRYIEGGGKQWQVPAAVMLQTCLRPVYVKEIDVDDLAPTSQYLQREVEMPNLDSHLPTWQIGTPQQRL